MSLVCDSQKLTGTGLDRTKGGIDESQYAQFCASLFEDSTSAGLIPEVNDRLRNVFAELSTLRERLRANEFALDAMDAAVFTLVGANKLASANRRAESLLRKRSIFKLQRGALVLVEKNAPAKWMDLLSRVREKGETESVRLMSILPRELMQVTVSRIASNYETTPAGTEDLVVIASSIDHRRVASVKQLTELFGLTQAEALLARALAQGVEPSTYAQKCQIKITTVRSQTKSVMVKLEIRRITDLVRVVLSVPPIR